MTNKSIIGQSLLWLGFLLGSFVSVLRLENEQSPWTTIPWAGYLMALAIGTAGVVLLRIHKAARRKESAASEAGLEAVAQNLVEAATKVELLKNRLDHFTCEEVLEYIDDECVPPLAEFADGRNVIADRYGTATYAAVMTEFASGERYLNRVWSAAADGYVDEVERSVQHAHSFFQAAVAKFNERVA